MKKICNIKPEDLNCNIFSCYDYDGLSLQELLCQFFTKIEECIEVGNNSLEMLEWLTNEGLRTEVAKQLIEWLENGTLEDIISKDVLGKITTKLDRLQDYVDIRDFGAKCDGITDDTKAIKDAIKAATNYEWRGSQKETWNQAKSGKIYFPCGQIVVSETIYIPPYTTIFGCHAPTGYNYHRIVDKSIDFKKNGTVIIPKMKDPKAFVFAPAAYDTSGKLVYGDINYVTPAADNFDRIEGINIRNIGIFNADPRNNICFGGISLIGAPSSNVIDCSIIGTDIGIYLQSNWCTNIVRTSLQALNYGILAYSHTNRIQVTECNIDHFGGTNGRNVPGKGYPFRRYTNADISALYPYEEGILGTAEQSMTTAVYMRRTWQMDIVSCSIQYYERGFFSAMSSYSAYDCWHEYIRNIDISRIHGSVMIRNMKKETADAYLIDSVGGGICVLDGISGITKNGDGLQEVMWNKFWYLPREVKHQSNVVVQNIPSVESSAGLNPRSVSGLLSFGGFTTNNSNVTMKDTVLIKKNTAYTQGHEVTVEYPAGFDKWNCIVLQAKAEITNGNYKICSDLALTTGGVTINSPITNENGTIEVLFQQYREN